MLAVKAETPQGPRSSSPASSPSSFLLLGTWEEQATAQVLVYLPSTSQTQTELQAPEFSLTQKGSGTAAWLNPDCRWHLDGLCLCFCP